MVIWWWSLSPSHEGVLQSSKIHQSIGWYLCSLQELNAVTGNPSYNDNPNGKQPQSATLGANHPRVAANLGMVWSTDINSISYVTYENGTLPSFSRTHLISMCPWIIGFTPIIRSYPMSMVDKTRDFSGPFKWGKEPQTPPPLAGWSSPLSPAHLRGAENPPGEASRRPTVDLSREWWMINPMGSGKFGENNEQGIYGYVVGLIEQEYH